MTPPEALEDLSPREGHHKPTAAPHQWPQLSDAGGLPLEDLTGDVPARYRARVSVHGLELSLAPTGQRMSLVTLSQRLTAMTKALEGVDRLYHPGRGTRPTWVVNRIGEDERHRIHVAIGPRFVSKMIARTPEELLAPAAALVQGAESLRQEPEVPEYFMAETISRLIRVGAPDDGVEEVALCTYNGAKGAPVRLSEPAFLVNARKSVSEMSRSFGSVAGVLEEMSSSRRGKRLKAGIYDPHTHHAVSVTLPETWEDRLRALWRRRVLVEGLVIRNSRCQVVRVEQVAEIHEYDSSSAVTPLSRLRGAAPEWLGGQSVDEYLGQVRSV